MAKVQGRGHALVLGGSIAGLLAARVLSDHFERVTIVERDEFPAAGVPRKGVPQGHHLHGLVAGGLLALEALFDDFVAGAQARGAIPVDVNDSGTWYIGGVRSLPIPSGLQGLLLSRPALEGYIRDRVLALDKVTTRQRCGVQALLGDARRVNGAVIAKRGAPRETEHVAAELVVDATGLGSRTPQALQSFGLDAPDEDEVVADVGYTSCYIRRRPSDLDGKLWFIMTPAPPHTRAGAALAVEGDRFIVSLTSYLGERGPTDYAGMLEFASSLCAPGLYQLLREAEPLSRPVQMRDPISLRRRYERLKRFPEGLVVCGDALCHFNPAYGQGMTVAALQARALDACLAVRPGRTALWRRYFRAVAPLVDVPWSIVVGGDLAFPGVQGDRPFGIDLVNAYFARLHRVAAVDPVVTLARTRVMNLTAPVGQLFSPSVLWRVLAPSWRGRALSAQLDAAE